MNVAGTFHYQPAFELDKSSEENLLEFEDIEVTESEICRIIVDYQFDDVDSQVIYGEIGSEDRADKFFLRANFAGEEPPKEIEIYVPQDQQNYPSTKEFWKGFNHRESDAARKTERVEEIAESFKQGNLVVINTQNPINEQDGKPAEKD